MGLFGPKNKMIFKTLVGLGIDKGWSVNLIKNDNDIELKVVGKKNKINIPYTDIINIAYGKYTETQYKDKSVIGRAIVGGVLTGGIGAVVGGMTGIGSKKKDKKMFVVEINYVTNGVKDTIILEDTLLIGTEKFIDSIREKILEVPKEQQTESNNINFETDDIASQLKKLSELKEQGILTEEEFLKGKSKILN